MVRVFLDANIFIDIVEQRRDISLEQFKENKLFISPLSIHILSYIYKYRIPDKKLLELPTYYTIVPADIEIVKKTLIGPTADFEDNVQLHSSAEAECDYFLTSDSKLLDMKFFGKTQILPQLENN